MRNLVIRLSKGSWRMREGTRKFQQLLSGGLLTGIQIPSAIGLGVRLTQEVALENTGFFLVRRKRPAT